MKQTFLAIRVILALVVLANAYFAYLFFLRPELVIEMYQFQAIDAVHQYLSMTVAAFFMVFACGALVPLVRPVKYGSIIIMLLLMHFSIFLVDVVLLAQGVMRFTTLLPAMAYFLIISTLLVRFYPIRIKEKRDSDDLRTQTSKKDIDATEGIIEQD